MDKRGCKRLISLCLILCVMLGLLPAGVFGAATDLTSSITALSSPVQQSNKFLNSVTVSNTGLLVGTYYIVNKDSSGQYRVIDPLATASANGKLSGKAVTVKNNAVVGADASMAVDLIYDSNNTYYVATSDGRYLREYAYNNAPMVVVTDAPSLSFGFNFISTTEYSLRIYRRITVGSTNNLYDLRYSGGEFEWTASGQGYTDVNKFYLYKMTQRWDTAPLYNAIQELKSYASANNGRFASGVHTAFMECMESAIALYKKYNVATGNQSYEEIVAIRRELEAQTQWLLSYKNILKASYAQAASNIATPKNTYQPVSWADWNVNKLELLRGNTYFIAQGNNLLDMSQDFSEKDVFTAKNVTISDGQIVNADPDLAIRFDAVYNANGSLNPYYTIFRPLEGLYFATENTAEGSEYHKLDYKGTARDIEVGAFTKGVHFNIHPPKDVNGDGRNDRYFLTYVKSDKGFRMVLNLDETENADNVFDLYKLSVQSVELYAAITRLAPYGDNSDGRYPEEIYNSFISCLTESIKLYQRYNVDLNAADEANLASIQKTMDDRAAELLRYLPSLTMADSVTDYIDIPVEIYDFRADGLFFDSLDKQYEVAAYANQTLTHRKMSYSREAVAAVVETMYNKNALHKVGGDNSTGWNSTFYQLLPTVSATPMDKGSYEETLAKTENGELRWSQVTSYFDLAYYLLTYLWQPANEEDLLGETPYNTAVSLEYLRLFADDKGNYLLSGENDLIAKDYYIYNPTPRAAGGSSYDTPAFLPLDGYGFEKGQISVDTDRGDVYAAYGYKAANSNFHYTMHAYGSFVYDQAKNLYFDLAGEEIYLYIDGKLVSNKSGRVELSSVSNLKDGEVYEFDLFYAQRRSPDARFKLATNIKVVDEGTVTSLEQYAKTYNGISKENLSQCVADNGAVYAGDTVVYSFSLTNTRELPVSNLSFSAPGLGSNISGSSLTLYNADLTNGAVTDITDISVYYNTVGQENAAPVLMSYSDMKSLLTTAIGKNGEIPAGRYGLAIGSEAELKTLLTLGIPNNCKISVYGFARKISQGDSPFTNTLISQCTYTQNGTIFNLRGSADCSVRIAAELPAIDPQKLVLDNGKAAEIPVNAIGEDIFAPAYVTVKGFVGISQKGSHGEVLKNAPSDLNSSTLETAQGIFTCTDTGLRYELTDFLEEAEKVNLVYALEGCRVADPDGKVTEYGYLLVELQILPATAVYYETDFAEGVFDLNTKSEYLYFDFGNTQEDQLRYGNHAYGAYNFDEEENGYWATRGTSSTVNVFNGYAIDNAAGTLTLQVAEGRPINDNYNYGPWLSTTGKHANNPSASAGSNMALSFDPAKAEIVQLRFKVEGCAVTSATDPRVVVVFDHRTEGKLARGAYDMVASYAYQEGEYILLNIPLSEEFKNADAICSFGFRFWDLQSVNEGKITIDYIYVGAEADFEAAVKKENITWQSVSDTASVQESKTPYKAAETAKATTRATKALDLPSNLTLKTNKSYTIAEGVTEQNMTFENNPCAIYVATFGKDSKTALKVSYTGYYSQGSTEESRRENMYTLPTAISYTTDQAKTYEAVTGETVLFAMNGSFFDGDMVNRGPVVMEGNVLQGWFGTLKDSEAVFARLKDGSYTIMDYTEDFSNVEEAFGARHWLVREGKNVIADKAEDSNLIHVMHPRTAIGLKADSSVVCIVVDGRSAAGYTTNGMNLPDLADLMISLGCVTAVNLDGGGSSTFATRRSSTDSLTMRNISSDQPAGQRTVATALLFISTEDHCQHHYSSNYRQLSEGRHELLCDLCQEGIDSPHRYENGSCICGKVEEVSPNLLFDFGNTPEDRARYNTAAYGYRNFDIPTNSTWWRGLWATQDTDSDSISRYDFEIFNENGTLRLDVADTSGAESAAEADRTDKPYNDKYNYGPRILTASLFYQWPAVSDQRTLALNYDPSSAEIVQIRFKTENCAATRTEPRVVLLFNHTTKGTTKAGTTLTEAYTFADDEYVVLEFKLSDEFKNADAIRTLGFRFWDIYSTTAEVDSNYGLRGDQGAVVIDYIYVGTREDAPNSGNLFMDFTNSKEARDRYTAHTYAGVNYDLAENWTSMGNFYPPVISDGVMTLKRKHETTTNGYVTVGTTLESKPLNYVPSADDYLQIRFKMENAVSSAASKQGRFVLFYADGENTTVPGNHDFVAYNFPSADVCDQGWVTMTFKISDMITNGKNFTLYDTIACISPGFYWLTSQEGELATFYIDYLYIGSEEDLPSLHLPTYGSDGVTSSDFSGGSSLFAEGTGLPETNPSGDYTGASFTFCGTGFDIISRLGEDQGQISVSVRDQEGKEVENRQALCKGDREVYQAPVLSVRDLPHGTYNVSVYVDGEFYFDALRIYEPMGSSLEIYQKQGEADPVYTSARQVLVTAENYAEATEGIAYVSWAKNQPVLMQSKNAGQEVYLAPDQAITFKLEVSGVIPAGVDVGARALDGASMIAVISDTALQSKPTGTEKILSTTAQYYDLKILPSQWQTASGKSYVCVTLLNSSSEGSIAITDIKCAYDRGNNVARTLRFVVESGMFSLCASHDWNDGEVLKEESCTEYGQRKLTCLVCGESKMEDIAPIGHSYEFATTAPTCTAEGKTVYTCKSCGDSYSETIPATGHTEVIDKAVDATCTATGLTEGKHCSVCSEVLVAQTAVPSTGHINTSTNTTDATCTEDGSVVVSCACGEVVSTEVVAALGHGYNAVVTAPTCTAAGYTTYTCSRCSDSYVGDEVAALGHSYAYTNNGENHTVTCANACGYEVTEAHAYADGLCVCGAVEITEPILDASLSFGAQLYLENDLTMAFRVKSNKLANYDLSTAYLVVEREVYETGAKEATLLTTEIRDYTISDDGRVVFSYPGIAAAQMNDSIKATLYIKDASGKEYISPVLNTSVATYLDGLLGIYANDSKMLTLIMDMLNYGAAAQIYFDRHADALVNEAFESFKTYASYASADFSTALEDLSAATEAEGKSGKLNLGLDLGTRIGIQYKVTLPADIAAEDVSLVIKDSNGNTLETLTLTGEDVTMDNKGRYIVNFYGSTSKDMRRVVYATAYANDEAITGTYAYSISTYAWGIQENASAMDAKLVSVTRMMMLYGDSASAYFG